MYCAIYKGSKRPDTYLYLPVREDFTSVPPALRNMLGALEFVMELELSPEKRLANANVADVMAQLADTGYYLQMPPRDHIPNAVPNSRWN